MPHIVIKTIEGKAEEQLQEAARKVSEVISKTLGKSEKYISVAVEEYSFNEWEGVYNECIKDKPLIVEPGYTNPKTFE